MPAWSASPITAMESPNRSARKFFGASIASTKAARRRSPARASASRSRSISSSSTVARSTSRASLVRARRSSFAYQSVLPIPLCLPKRRVELFRNEESFVDQLHGRFRVTTEVFGLVTIKLEDAALRERNVRTGETLSRLGKSDRRVAQIPPGVGRERNRHTRSANAGDLVSVGADLRHERRIRAQDFGRLG